MRNYYAACTDADSLHEMFDFVCRLRDAGQTVYLDPSVRSKNAIKKASIKRGMTDLIFPEVIEKMREEIRLLSEEESCWIQYETNKTQ